MLHAFITPLKGNETSYAQLIVLLLTAIFYFAKRQFSLSKDEASRNESRCSTASFNVQASNKMRLPVEATNPVLVTKSFELASNSGNLSNTVAHMRLLIETEKLANSR